MAIEIEPLKGLAGLKDLAGKDTLGWVGGKGPERHGQHGHIEVDGGGVLRSKKIYQEARGQGG